jgi:heme-degrading monooxygenase HmoA
MFTHQVLFRIQKKNVPTYIADCAMWGREAKKHPGFIAYGTLQRTNEKDQYASFYTWKSEKYHAAFMKKQHDLLVSKSKCPVEVIGYFNYKTV